MNLKGKFHICKPIKMDFVGSDRNTKMNLYMYLYRLWLLFNRKLYYIKDS